MGVGEGEGEGDSGGDIGRDEEDDPEVDASAEGYWDATLAELDDSASTPRITRTGAGLFGFSLASL